MYVELFYKEMSCIIQLSALHAYSCLLKIPAMLDLCHPNFYVLSFPNYKKNRKCLQFCIVNRVLIITCTTYLQENSHMPLTDKLLSPLSGASFLRLCPKRARDIFILPFSRSKTGVFLSVLEMQERLKGSLSINIMSFNRRNLAYTMANVWKMSCIPDRSLRGAQTKARKSVTTFECVIRL